MNVCSLCLSASSVTSSQNAGFLKILFQKKHVCAVSNREINTEIVHWLCMFHLFIYSLFACVCVCVVCVCVYVFMYVCMCVCVCVCVCVCTCVCVYVFLPLFLLSFVCSFII